MLFTERFNEALHDLKVNQVKLAKYCSVSRQLITEFKKGRSLPSLDVLCLICRYLDFTSDYLLGLKDY